MVQTTETNTTGTATGCSTTAYNNYCFNRLPCGYCRITMSPCMAMGNTITVTPTWNLNELTCQSNGTQK